jgi:TetR/AcrR family transcriptional regulator, tetracycline repressor protein
MAPERIVAAALALVDAEGADALSMRTLAQRLDSGTATLYRHFANRAELVARVVDHVFGEIRLDADQLAGLDWKHSCKTVATAMFAALAQHPHVVPLLLEQTPLGPNAMAIREAGLAMFLNNGFPPELAARSYATLSRYVLGFAIQLTADPDSQTTQDSAAFHQVDPARFPATLAVADTLPVPLDVEFTFGLDLILNGLDQLR